MNCANIASRVISENNCYYVLLTHLILAKYIEVQLHPCFAQINSYRNEDLHHSINQLQYVHDYHEIRRQQSEVHGENYGKKYPTFTIMEMKVCWNILHARPGYSCLI